MGTPNPATVDTASPLRERRQSIHTFPGRLLLQQGSKTNRSTRWPRNTTGSSALWRFNVRTDTRKSNRAMRAAFSQQLRHVQQAVLAVKPLRVRACLYGRSADFAREKQRERRGLALSSTAQRPRPADAQKNPSDPTIFSESVSSVTAVKLFFSCLHVLTGENGTLALRAGGHRSSETAGLRRPERRVHRPNPCRLHQVRVANTSQRRTWKQPNKQVPCAPDVKPTTTRSTEQPVAHRWVHLSAASSRRQTTDHKILASAWGFPQLCAEVESQHAGGSRKHRSSKRFKNTGSG